MTNASLSANFSEKVGWVVPTAHRYRIGRVWYNNPTGLAADPANYFTIAVKGAVSGTVYASWSTQSVGSGGNGALVADTPVSLVLNTNSANLVLAENEVLQVTYTKSGTATLPAGALVIEGRFV